jgi:hypothetical protein
MTVKPENWVTLTPDEKRTWRLENFRNSGKNIKFVSKEAEHNFHTRVRRMIDVYNVREPDRVPLNVYPGNLPLTMDGLEGRDMFYNPARACEAAMKFNDKYSTELESFTLPVSMLTGQFMETLDYKLYLWPGHGLPDNAGGWQYIEGEYMLAEEYDDLIRDPTDFWLRKYLPRVMGSFQPFGMFQPFTNIIENVHLATLSPFANSRVQDMFRTFIRAGQIWEQTGAAIAPYLGLGPARGFVAPSAVFCLAPFDIIGDTLRGTSNIMKDMFRRPQKLLDALDVVAEVTISNILNSPGIDSACLVSYPLHKGADGWMSQAQFEKFYWPSLKKVMDTFIKEGLIQSLFAEGSYNTRLECIDQFPKGTVSWYFDQTDMSLAKKILGKNCCIQGNVPSSLLVTGEPTSVKDYCKKLIETCAPGGGYVLAPGAHPENPKLENLKAMVEAVNAYGYYRKK